MAHFFNLPKSVRKQIYDYCLIVGEIDPFPSGREWKSTRNKVVGKPAVALLLVHPWIEAEAKDILYGGNVWLMLKGSRVLAEIFFWNCHRKQFRRIRTVFSQHDLITRDWIMESPNRCKGMQDSRLQRTEQLHGDLANELHVEWLLRLTYLICTTWPMLECVEMDLNQCYCPIGCCRPVEAIIFRMLTIFIAKSTPRGLYFKLRWDVEVTGFQSHGEEEHFHDVVDEITCCAEPREGSKSKEIHANLMKILANLGERER